MFKSASFYNETDYLLIPVVLFIPIQFSNLFHLIRSKFKIKDTDIFSDMLCIAGPRDYRYTVLQIPPEDHLHRRFPVSFCDFSNNLII